MAIFTVDWEGELEAVLPKSPNPQRVRKPTIFLLQILMKYNVKAIFYILGYTKLKQPEVFKWIKDSGHMIADHGEHHSHNYYGEDPYRSPYWDTTPMPWPPSGGFFFRFMPFWYVKWAVQKSGVFWIHPHDIDEKHPKLRNPFLNWKRHVGLKTAKKKLERLLQEVKFDAPSED